MDEKTFFIPNISCGHCTAAIRNEILELDGVASVDGSPEDRTVTVQWTAPATEAVIVARLEEINYPPSPSVAG
jgi:copper chaperone CopZ